MKGLFGDEPAIYGVLLLKWKRIHARELAIERRRFGGWKAARVRPFR